MVSTSVLKVNLVLDFPCVSLCFWGVRSNRGWTLLSFARSHEKYIKDGKVLNLLGFKSKVMPGPLTDLSA